MPLSSIACGYVAAAVRRPDRGMNPLPDCGVGLRPEQVEARVPEPTRVIGPDDPGHAGQRHYTPTFLRIYDLLVLGLFTRIWRCPNRRLVAHYRRHIGRRHLDVGPGTGYFLRRAGLQADVDVTLLDPNPNVLAHAGRRLAPRAVTLWEADVRAPLTGVDPFDSVALNYVLHCLPGPMSRKADAIGHLAAVLHPDGVLFGATVLGTPELHTPVSRLALRSNNRRGIFDNHADTMDGLRAVLGRSFDTVAGEVVGSVAVFAAHDPRDQVTAARARGSGSR